MVRMLLLAIAMLAVQGCMATSSKRIYMQDGAEGYKIECEGLNPCYDKAGEVCKGKGYTMITNSSGTKANTTVFVIKCNK